MLEVMYAFYPSTVLIALLRLSAVSAIPTPDTSVIPQVQTCTTSWNPGESNPQGLTGYCEYEGVNCDKGLSVMSTTGFGEIGCTSRKRLIFPPLLTEILLYWLDSCTRTAKKMVNQRRAVCIRWTVGIYVKAIAKIGRNPVLVVVTA